MTPVALKFIAARRLAVVLAVVAGLGLALSGAAVTVAPPAGATNPTLPAPSWWNGMCDDGHYFAVTGRHSYPLGASFLGVQVCGPRHGSDGGPDVLWTRAGWGEYEWECPELAFRFMYLAYGISSAWQANGNTVYDNYNSALYGGGLVKTPDGTTGSAPMPGDVMSFNATATSSAGHVAVVESSSVDANGNGSLRLITQNDTVDGWRTLTVVNWSVQSGGLGSTIGWLHKPGWWTGPGSQPAVEYHALAPLRLMDTRADPAYHVGPAHRFGAGETQDLTVTGGSVPADATGVVMNVTAVDPTLASHVDVWPSGASRPNVSNLNVTAGQTVANLVTAKVGAGGRVSIANNAGSVDVVVDLVGYFQADPSGSRLTPVVPIRIIDTRADPIYHIGPVSRLGPSPAAQNVTVVGGSTGVPAGATAVVANVTVVDPSAASHLDVWPAGDPHPNASNINFVAGQTVPNLVVVRVGVGNEISVANQAGSVDVIVDIVGYYRVDPSASGFVALDPTRIADTRSDLSYHVGPLTRFDDQSHDLMVTGGAGGIPTDATAVVANVIAVDPSMASHLDVWPAGSSRPEASNLNFIAGETVPNLVVVKIGSGGKISLQDQVGSVDVIVDVVGFYR
jgi:hypothetical protein